MNAYKDEEIVLVHKSIEMPTDNRAMNTYKHDAIVLKHKSIEMPTKHVQSYFQNTSSCANL